MPARQKFVLDKKTRSEQRKFFRLCSEEDRLKLIGKQTMTINDLERISYLVETLGFIDYYIYITSRFGDVWDKLVERDRFLDEKGLHSDGWFFYEGMPRYEQWFKDFCDGIKNEKTKEKILEQYYCEEE